jgi:magnesium chelatase family protein
MAYAPFGADGIIIRVEADIRRGIPGIDISGLAEGAVREARERVRAAFRNSGYEFPLDRILINLAPAGVRKEGAALDLPIALAVMAAAGLAPAPDNLLAMGELELSGTVRPVRGVLAAVRAGLREGIRDFIVPSGNAREAAILAGQSGLGQGGGNFAAAASLREALHALVLRAETGSLPATGFPLDAPASGPAGTFTNGFTNGSGGSGTDSCPPPDFSEVRGQGRYKRALEIAAAGGHNLLVFGPPGAGKTMLARSLPSIMAPLGPAEAVEVTRLYSLAGLFGAGLITRPPFRSPHHSASAEGILGGGRSVRPGEISLAHLGVLFLDEAPEFRSNVLQALREPLEDGVITISRAEGPVKFPAEFQLVMAANACPCGRLGIREDSATASGEKSAEGPEFGTGFSCLCSPEEVYRYWRRFGSSLLDRVELRVPSLPPAGAEMEKGGGDASAEIARRVCRAAEIQRERMGRIGGREGGSSPDAGLPRPETFLRNARIPAGLVERCCPLTRRGAEALRDATARLSLSGRAYHGILRVGRTIADLEGRDSIDAEHISEAVDHRRHGDDPYDILGSGIFSRNLSSISLPAQVHPSLRSGRASP